MDEIDLEEMPVFTCQTLVVGLLGLLSLIRGFCHIMSCFFSAGGDVEAVGGGKMIIFYRKTIIFFDISIYVCIFAVRFAGVEGRAKCG